MSHPTTPEGAVPPAPPGSGEALVDALQERLGLAFRDRATALSALTHKSWVNEHREEARGDNERLEFLGDAVIDLAVSHRLMERFPQAREGELSKMRAAVVDEAGLAGLSRAIDLGGLLRLGRGEERTGGRQKASLLADAMEAVFAAVYLEGGLAGVLALVDRFLGEAFGRAADGTLDRDWKTQLQELAQSRLRVAPRYRVVAELGPDHAKVFDVELELRGELLGRAQGRSKKDAEQAAAKVALDALTARFAGGADAAPAEAAAAPGDASGAGREDRAGLEVEAAAAPEVGEGDQATAPAAPSPSPEVVAAPRAAKVKAPPKRIRKAAPRLTKKAAGARTRRAAAPAVRPRRPRA